MKTALVLTFTALLAAAAAADDQKATNPIRYTWIATSVADWSTAASAMMAANGDGTIMALPTGRASHPWLMIRKVEEGSIYIPDDEPHRCDVFDTASQALAHYATLYGCSKPMLLVAPDGRQLVLSLRTCDAETRQRVVRR